MSDQAQFTTGEKIMAFLTAWIIGSSVCSGVAVVAAGKVNWQGLAAAAFGGLATACKDYRSLNRIPPVRTNGDTQPSMTQP